MTLLEITIAAGMLAVLLAMSAQMMRVVSGQQRAADRRVVALQAVQAIAEEIGNARWDQVTAQAIEQVTIPDAAAAYLPGAQMSVTVEDETEPTAKRVAIELSWTGPHGLPTAVRLTTWVYPEPREAD